MSRSAPLLLLLLASGTAFADPWPAWRGPHGNGTSDEVGLPERLDPATSDLLWSVDLPGRGTPVVYDGHVYAWGYRRTGDDVVEVLDAFDLVTGDLLWERTFRDFLSDIIYDRYSIGAPTVDPATGDVFVQSSAGELMAFSSAGELRWSVPMMDAYGRLTFPNGRTGSPVVDGDLVILHGITSFWGRNGPARDRFFAFDKATGEPVWSSTPGIGPKDSSWSTPLLETRDGRRLLYAGTGCGQVVAVDARTGEPVWRHPMAVGGVNVSVVREGDVLFATHDMENLDSTKTGGTVALDLNAPTKPSDEGAPLLDGVVWRSDTTGFSSSPVLEDGVIYQMNIRGEVVAYDLSDGKVLWRRALGEDQLHASPLWADGKLYVPMRDGGLHVLQAGRDGGKVLSSVKLAGNALGAPAVSDGRVIVHTTEKLYVFGEARPVSGRLTVPAPYKAGPPVALRVRPEEILLRPGEKVRLMADRIDAQGRVVDRVPVESAVPYVPPTAKVKAQMDATFKDGFLVASPTATLSAGAWKVTAKGLQGETKGRTVVGVPYAEDFESEALSVDSPEGPFAYPPLPWIGARFKWEVRQVDGSNVLAKTLTNMIFQRSVVFLGHPDEHAYTLSASMRTDGNRRSMSSMGLVNQRYLIALKGNQRVLEVSSNQERLKQSVPFEVTPGTWYRLKTQVVVDASGTAHVRAKAWPRDEAEPDAWTIEVAHPDGHVRGSPGLFGFSPGNSHKVYLDDIAITPIQEAP